MYQIINFQQMKYDMEINICISVYVLQHHLVDLKSTFKTKTTQAEVIVQCFCSQ
jgi:hypothetical protein